MSTIAIVRSKSLVGSQSIDRLVEMSHRHVEVPCMLLRAMAWNYRGVVVASTIGLGVIHSELRTDIDDRKTLTLR